ncbi:hypothetical protein [Paenibacillus sp. TC-CSREp1]|uniref:hypothetical protein n=1 Tax=Paenibacillus sp. TC-CSREp1 TaxID=3410089 RepID=UPI003CFB5A58
MSFLKGLGQFAGEVSGRVLGGSVRVVGEVTGSSFIKDIGNGVERATINTGKTVGQLASGTYDLASGVIRKDDGAIQAGFADLKHAVNDTAKGVAVSAKYVYNSGKDVVMGIKEDDVNRAKLGAKHLIAAAAVTTLAVGVLDAVDGADAADAVDGADIDADEGTH